jgi:hypothetical protein
MAEQDEKETGSAEEKDDASESKSTSAEQERSAEEEPRPGEAFKQGLSLLWKAAKSTADELKKEVDKGRVSGALTQAGQDLENAATQAAKAVEDFLGRMSPPEPKMDEWPAGEGDKTKGEQVDADIPADGGTTEDGERRDMRIQVDEDDDKDK